MKTNMYVPAKRVNFLDAQRGGRNKPGGGGGLADLVETQYVVEQPMVQRIKPMKPLPARGIVTPNKNPKLNLVITRQTANIPSTLPFCLFAPVGLPDNYTSIFQYCRVFPAGGAITVTFDNNGDCLQTWTVAGNTDILRIHDSGLVPYATKLKMLEAGGMFDSSFIRYSTTAVVPDTQYSAYNIFTGASDFYGVVGDDGTPVLPEKSPDQFQAAITDVMIPLEIDNTCFVVHGFSAAAHQLNWALWDLNYTTSSVIRK